MTDYSKMTSAYLSGLRTIHSRAATELQEWIWRHPEQYVNRENFPPPETMEDALQMKADLEQVVAILDKYKRKGKR